MIKTLQNTLKQDRVKFKVPRSVQDAVPIQKVWGDGVFQFGTKFSKTIRFSDINYAIASKEDKLQMFLGYSELLNALDTGATTKITIHNKHINRKNFEDAIRTIANHEINYGSTATVTSPFALYIVKASLKLM